MTFSIQTEDSRKNLANIGSGRTKHGYGGQVSVAIGHFGSVGIIRHSLSASLATMRKSKRLSLKVQWRVLELEVNNLPVS